MTAYFNYLAEVLRVFAKSVGSLFKGSPMSFNEQSTAYTSAFKTYSVSFSVGGWIMYVLVILLFAALLTGIVLFLIWLFKKVIKKKGKGNEDVLRDEIERLNLELYETTMEKNRILGLSKEGKGVPTGMSGKDGKDAPKGGSRFSRLITVDEKYKDGDVVVTLPEENANITLKEICERFRNFACSQMKLYYTIDVVRQFFAAMGTSKLIILEGISGTGKTSLPYCMGRFFKNPAAICSVQPAWRDRNELLGYYNDFTKKFTETEFLRAVYEATYHNDNCLIVLDEMNLARIEYYFAEFLSIMEMPDPNEWIIDVIASARSDDPKHLQGGKLLIPQNIWFVGTANNDDSTFTITDKVYDRAMSLFFENKGQPFDAPYTEPLIIPNDYFLSLFDKAKQDYSLSEDAQERFAQLDDFVIDHFKIAFGNRIMKQILSFVPCYIACGGTELEALDFIFKTKILKKFEVLNVAFLREELGLLDEELTRLFGASEFQLSRDKIRMLIKMSR